MQLCSITSLLPVWMRLKYYVNNNMYYVENVAEHIKASLSIHKQCAGRIRWKNDKLRWRLKVTRTSVKDTGMLQPENFKPQEMPSVAAKLRR